MRLTCQRNGIDDSNSSSGRSEGRFKPGTKGIAASSFEQRASQGRNSRIEAPRSRAHNSVSIGKQEIASVITETSVFCLVHGHIEISFRIRFRNWFGIH